MSYNELPEYNGYTNYPTWVVELWMEENSNSYNFFLDAARGAKDIWELSKFLKHGHEEDSPTADDASVYSDLMTWALQYVKWEEIAQNLFDQSSEES